MCHTTADEIPAGERRRRTSFILDGFIISTAMGDTEVCPEARVDDSTPSFYGEIIVLLERIFTRDLCGDEGVVIFLSGSVR